MGLTIICVYNLNLGNDVYVADKRLDKFPYKIKKWSGEDVAITPSVKKELNTDVFIYRFYHRLGEEPIFLYIGYYGTKKGGRSEHSPDGCYPGSGWAILEETTKTLKVSFDNEEWVYSFNVMNVFKDNRKQLVYHWYQTQGLNVISSGIQHNLNRFKNRLLYNRDDGAFIRVSMDMQENLAEAKSELEEFIQTIFPIIVELWPKELEG